MFLLGLSNLVPLDMLIKRLKRVTAPLGRWDASNDPVVSEFIQKAEEDSDLENGGRETQLGRQDTMVVDTSISNSKSHSLSRVKQEI
jgi:hypothetical protein